LPRLSQRRTKIRPAPIKPGTASWPSQGDWTFADYVRIPEGGYRYEVIRGRLYVTPPPIFGHQYIISRLILFFGNFMADNDKGILLTGPLDVILPDGIATPVQPDVIFLLKENLPSWEAENIQGVPDLTFEIESPITRRRDRTLKQEAYREAGVPEYWRVNPRIQTVTVLVLSEDRAGYVERVYGPGDTLRSALLPGLAIRVDDLFFLPERRPPSGRPARFPAIV
jgi:Uma2 family endonuclease